MNPKIRHAWLAGLYLCCAMAAQPVAAQILYGASNGQEGNAGLSSLYTINPDTGEATLVGPVGFENVTGLAFLPDGRLVASVNGDTVVPPGPVALLIEIDVNDGSGTLIGTIADTNAGSCGRIPDISYDVTRNTLFGYADNCSGDPEGLFTINPVTGAGTSVGASGYAGGGNGLAAQPGTGTLYATPFDNQSLVTINPVTGLGTDVAGSAGNVSFRVNALDFHPETGDLYGSYNSGGITYLVTIDLADGTTTQIGETILGLDALIFEREFVPTAPVPATGRTGMLLLALLLLLMMPLALRRRKPASV